MATANSYGNPPQMLGAAYGVSTMSYDPALPAGVSSPVSANQQFDYTPLVNYPSTSRDPIPRHDSALIALSHRQDMSSDPNKALDTNSSDGDFEPFGDVPNAHECFMDCTHCRACFDLDYDLYPRFSEFEGEREIESRLSHISTAAKNGCEICSLLIRVQR